MVTRPWHSLGGMTSVLIVTLAFSFPALAANGNPNKVYGAHDYQLMIIGMNDSNGKLGNGGDDNGRRMFVRLTGKTKILLSEGPYDVIDADGTDGRAQFQLPNPAADGDGTSEYRIYVRALGTPGGWATITTCVEDSDLGTEGDQMFCSTTSSSIVMRDSNGNGNKPHWQNVTRQLLYLEIDIDGDGKLELVPLFDDSLQGYYWDYDNNGLRLAQMRFYSVPQDVCSEAGGTVVDGYCELP